MNPAKRLYVVLRLINRQDYFYKHKLYILKYHPMYFKHLSCKVDNLANLAISKLTDEDFTRVIKNLSKDDLKIFFKYYFLFLLTSRIYYKDFDLTLCIKSTERETINTILSSPLQDRNTKFDSIDKIKSFYREHTGEEFDGYIV